jgi:hypothetical protein
MSNKINYYGGWTRVNGELHVDLDEWFYRSQVDIEGIHVENMPTAIVVIYAGQDGFILASDGFGSRGGSEEQKIFPTCGPFWTLAYAVSGAASCYKLGHDPCKQAYRDAAKALESADPSDLPTSLRDYADRFAKLASQWLNPYFEGSRDDNAKVRIDFAGYFNGKPSMSTRQMSFKGDSPETIKATDLICGHAAEKDFAGSPPIMDRILKGHPDFAEFTVHGFAKLANRESISLTEAVEVAKKYIQACKTPQARKIDEFCKSIDGRIQVAKITTEEGFKWEDPPAASF